MQRSHKRLLLLIGGIPLVLVLSALIYMVGMALLEGSPRGFWDSLQWAGETLSTTGYGADAKWRHPVMVLFVVFIQFIGVFLVFLIIPIYLIPFLEERFEERLPRVAPKISDHVVIFRYGPAVETLIEQLRAARLPMLVLETDEDNTRLLVERRVPVLFGREENDVLEACRLMQARALVANGRDEENAGITLRARQMGFEGDILALVEEPLRRHALEIAGANAVYTPRHILAAALASRASEKISPRLAGLQQLSSRLEVRELRIQATSPLVGKNLAQAGIAGLGGITVIGQWVGGKLISSPSPDMRLERRGILVVVGTPESLDRLADLASGTAALRREGLFVVAGFGEVGRKVHQLLTDVGEEVRTVDREPREGVDLVGNVLDPDVLRNAGVHEAQSVILALDTDDATLFATVIVQDLAPDAPVIARVNQARNVENIHRAGADFALSISQVSGQMLSHWLFRQDALSLDTHLKILKTDGKRMGSGSTPAVIRERTHCTVIAVERGDEVIVDLDNSFQFKPDDHVYICGSHEGIRAFHEEFGDDERAGGM